MPHLGANVTHVQNAKGAFLLCHLDITQINYPPSVWKIKFVTVSQSMQSNSFKT